MTIIWPLMTFRHDMHRSFRVYVIKIGRLGGQSRAIFRFCSFCSKAPPRDCRTSKLWFKNIRIKGFQMRYYSSGLLNKMTSKTYRNLLQFLKSFLLYLVWFFKNFKLKSKQNSIISILLHKMEIWKKVLFELECSRVI